ncbi:type IV secretion protein Rhs, partial [Salmonella enterica]|nr:type IV secretion protein Rhs [Salmonella enterica]
MDTGKEHVKCIFCTLSGEENPERLEQLIR